MAMLKFNKGELASLKNQAIVEGNVYITTDEHAMYVDVAAGKRIRIGQIIEKTSAEWESLAQPYDASAYYYITNLNALVRWNGTKWVQINGTKDLQDRIGALETAINDETNGLKAKVAGLATDLDALEETVEGIVTTGGEKNVITTVKVNGEALTPDADRAVDIVLGDLAALDKVDTDHLADALKTRLTNIENKNTAQDTAINTLNGDANTAGSVAKAVKDAVDAAKTSLKNNEIKAAADAAAAAQGTADEALEKANANAGNITTLQGTVGGHTTSINGLTTRMGTAEGDIDTLEGRMDAVEGVAASGVSKANKAQEDATKALNAIGEGYNENNTIAAKITEVAGNVSTNAGEITGIKTRLGTAEGTITTHGTDIAQLKLDVVAAKNQADKGVEDAGKAATAASVADGKAVAAQNKADANALAITGLETEVGTIKSTYATQAALTGAQEALEAEIKKVDDKLPAMVEATAAAKKAADDAQDAADKAQGEVDALELEVAGLKTSIGNLSNIMNFRGVVEAFSDVENPEDGDVIIIGDKEYVYSDKNWHEYGDASGNADAITKLTARVAENEGDIAALEATINGTEGVDGLVKKVADNNTAITGLQTTVGDMYTNAQIDALLTWGTF